MKHSIITYIAAFFAFFIIVVNAQEKNYDSRKAMEFAKQGYEQLMGGEFENAINLYDKAIEYDPFTALYTYEKALVYYHKKDFKTAAYLLDSILFHSQVDDRYYQILGNCYDLMGDKNKAIETYNKGLDRFYHSGRLNCELGVTMSTLRPIKEVIGYWETGLIEAPAYPNNYYYLTMVYAKGNEKIWGLVYGEIYCNIADNQNKIDSISKTIYNTYKEALILKADSSSEVRLSAMTPSSDNKKTGYKLTFESVYQAAMLEAINRTQNRSNSFSLSLLNEIRSNFIDVWYEKKYNEKFPNSFMDFLKKIKDNNYFELYNYCYFALGSEEEFAEWAKGKEEQINSFIEWINNNRYINSEFKPVYRFMYNY